MSDQETHEDGPLGRTTFPSIPPHYEPDWFVKTTKRLVKLHEAEERDDRLAEGASR
jgi:hypothetical protein